MQTRQAQAAGTARGGGARLDHLCDVEWHSRPDAETIVGPTVDGASIQFDVKGFGLRLERAAPL